MTTRPNLPLSGGVYIEHPDGRLERIDDARRSIPTRPPRRPPPRGAADGTAATPTTHVAPAPKE